MQLSNYLKLQANKKKIKTYHWDTVESLILPDHRRELKESKSWRYLTLQNTWDIWLTTH